jgi:outer membrane protein TolC
MDRLRMTAGMWLALLAGCQSVPGVRPTAHRSDARSSVAATGRTTPDRPATIRESGLGTASTHKVRRPSTAAPSGDEEQTVEVDTARPTPIRLTAAERIDEGGSDAAVDTPAEEMALPDPIDERPALGPTEPITQERVVDAIYQSFPLLRLAILERQVASGKNVAAMGAFDTKLYADSMNEPEGFYQTYRNSVGFDQPLMSGGSVFGGYRLGRGNFEPWYGNRETNDGGELKLGLAVPLWQNRLIDERRAELWTTTFGVQGVEPEIRTQLLTFVRDGSIAYWDWVAAGRTLVLAEQLLKIARDRDTKMRIQVREGDLAEYLVTDNERILVSRRVKLLESQRKFQTTAAKLSIYLRLDDGRPFVPGRDLLPEGFPEPSAVNRDLLEQDIVFAQERRPEITSLDIQRRVYDVELNQARNLTQPELDATVMNSKDVGGPTKSRDKTPYELEAGVSFAVPLQRRKAYGKLQAAQAKLAQLVAKRQYTADKIGVEVRSAVIALDLAFQAISQAREAIRLNEEMERFELIQLEGGKSDLLRVNLRETATFDSRVTEVEALVRYYESLAEYRAAVAADLPEIDGLMEE